MKEGIILELNKNTAVLITAEGEFLSIPSQPTWSIGDEIKYNPKIIASQTTNNRYKNNNLMKKGVWIALAACIMLLLIPLTTITEASTYVTIDINPSIEIELKGDKVINVKALNNDAEKIIINIPKEYQDIFSITTYIIDKSKEFGYLTQNEENYITIGVCDNNTDFLINDYEKFIKEKLAEQRLNAEILVVNGTSEDKKLADNKNISLGKYVLQQNENLEGKAINNENENSSNGIGKSNSINPNNKSDNSDNNSSNNNVNTNNPNSNVDNDNKNNIISPNNGDNNKSNDKVINDNTEIYNDLKNNDYNQNDAANPNTNNNSNNSNNKNN